MPKNTADANNNAQEKKCPECQFDQPLKYGHSQACSHYKESRTYNNAQEWRKNLRDKIENYVRVLIDISDGHTQESEGRIALEEINQLVLSVESAAIVRTRKEARREANLIRQEAIEECKVTGETSDGYHTFNELYEFRKVYNALLFNEWAKQGLYDVHKSKKHNDGADCFGGGWFIVMAQLPTGQVSNHYEMKDWDLFKCDERWTAEAWDGHTAQDVLKRLSALEKLKDNNQ